MADNSDHRVPRRFGAAATALVQPLADSILIRPERPGQAFIDDGHVRRSIGIARVEKTPADQRNAHRLEVIRGYNPLIGLRRGVFERHRLRVYRRGAGPSVGR